MMFNLIAALIVIMCVSGLLALVTSLLFTPFILGGAAIGVVTVVLSVAIYNLFAWLLNK